MDIVTQGLVGAALAQALAKKKEARLATFVGFCAPLLADADVLIRSSEDPLLFLEFHRHFTHSLFFIPIGALIASLILWPLLRKRLEFKSVYLYAFLGFATAGILDACTSYGTHLLWPLYDDRVAWSIISIFDPIFSLVLLLAITIGAIKYNPVVSRIGMLFAVGYLSFGGVQHDRAQSIAELNAKDRGHDIKRLVVKPTMGNILLWRSVYETDGKYYIDAVRIDVLGNSKVFPGDSIKAFSVKNDIPDLAKKAPLYRDIERFNYYSDGFLAWHPEKSNVLGDVRYSMLPTSTRPLWGIKLNPNLPDMRVTFNTYRSMPKTERKYFLSMLLNKDKKESGVLSQEIKKNQNKAASQEPTAEAKNFNL